MKILPLSDWDDDSMVLVLGIIPLLVVSDTIEKGLAIGIANFVVLVITCLIISAIQNLVPREIRLVTILLINVSVVCLVGLVLQVVNFEISQLLGIYLSLIAVSTLVLASTEEYAIRHNLADTLFFSVTTGLVILFITVIIASIREYSGLVLLKQPAGTFLVLGTLIALFNFFNKKSKIPD